MGQILVEGVESINRELQLGHAVLAASPADAGQSSLPASSRERSITVLAFGSVEVEPLCKMKVDTGVTRPYSRIASDSRWASGRHQIAFVKVAGGDIEGDSGTDIDNRSSPEALVDVPGAN